MTDLDEEQQDATPEPVSPEAFMAQVTQAGNIVETLDEVRPMKIAADVLRDYRTDKESMKDWLTKMKKGIDLATLVKDDKTYPFDKASNIKFPLVTSAALQFNARAYPAIVPSDEVVKVRTFGKDEGGLKAARAARVAAHMSWQLTSQIEEWEAETDRLLVQLPIVGTMIRKTWWDAERKRLRSRVVEPGRFIVNKNVRCLEDAPRLTEEIPLYPVEVAARIGNGTFIAFDYGKDGEDDQKPEQFIEQHCLIDLDDDGYPEPYIATVHIETQKLVRLVADFEERDVTYRTERQMVMQPVMTPMGPMEVPQQVEVPVGVTHIRRGSYFTDYHFLPAMDGGFWGTGLGLLLGDISSSINSIINMLIDAGHYASLGGGFIGSEFRIKGGNQRMKPGEWRLTQNKGADLRNSIVPMTYPGPDATLFQMLGLLIEAGREIASVKDIMTGDTGTKNMTATTTLALIEQGMMVFTAAYKRIYRSLKDEFRIIAKTNAETVGPEEYNQFHDEEQMYDPAQEYNLGSMDILPVADPRSVTKMQEAAKAELIMQLAREGMADPQEAGKRVMEAAEIGDTEELAVKPNPMAEPMAMLQMKAAEADVTQKMAEIQLTMAKAEEATANAQKTYAETGLEQDRLRVETFEALTSRLKAQNDGLALALSARSGSMAGTPRNANAA